MRQDIQFLRGLAVSLVVLEHAGLGVAAGYLGVDIFFVISGYLITRLLQTRLEAGSFSFSEFYVRRAKRLLPAAFTTFAITAAAAPFFLSTLELDAFRDQLLGSLTFVANMVLYNQSGYFDTEAAQKPLLHIWSLSLEEQYYFALPLLLFVVRRRFWTHVVAAILIGSMALCLFYLTRDPGFAFYSLPTRAWELSIGSLVALLRLDANPHSIYRRLFWPACATVLLIPFFPTNVPHPSLDAMLVCLGTAIIIINGRAFFGRIYPLQATAWVGDASYSIYLAHWPIMAFINVGYLTEVPLTTRLLSVALALSAGLALHYLIERPIHRSTSPLSLRRTIATAIPAAFLTAAPLFVGDITIRAANSNELDFREIRRPNYGLNQACDQGKDKFALLPECTSGKMPTVMIWGDSLAMHLIQGIMAAKSFDFVQATRSSCPPVFGYSQFNRHAATNEDWAHRCVAFNRSVLAFLTKRPEIETVVIGSTFFALSPNSLSPRKGEPWQALVYGRGEQFTIRDIERERSIRALSNTIRALQSIGKRVVIFAPPPAGRLNYSECIERQLSGKITFGMSSCAIPVKEDQARYGEVLSILHELSGHTGVQIINPRQGMCDEQFCQTIRDNVPLYRDTLHLSQMGSALLGSTFRWDDLIQSYAR